ncbi:mitochondrial amidoxime-reducing component 1-like [Halichondria panicea]|uniref:mitochondrial amidoxime-reducing component 1-like n=1 Tax=Halichondria panicea TaxID=6063 RepID=UPI00312BC228
MDISPQALGVGSGIAASTLLWWLLRGKVEEANPDMPPSSPSAYLTPVAKVSKLCVYPVKSCHRIEVDSADVFKRGLLYDRCWVIIDKTGSFCSQRKQPSMAKIQPELTFLDDGQVQLSLNAPDMSKLTLPQPPEDAQTTLVKVWAISGEGVDMGEEASQWISQYLGLDGCRLYYMAPRHRARVLRQDQRWEDIARHGEETSFSDWSPVLMASEASLELLNSKLDTALLMERFRPNVVLSGCLPHAEDSWEAVRVGDELILRGLKACGRCKMTRVHQEQGYVTGEEPLKTLKEYRLHETVYNCPTDSRFGPSPLFGYSFSVLNSGRINIEDTLYVQS